MRASRRPVATKCVPTEHAQQALIAKLEARRDELRTRLAARQAARRDDSKVAAMAVCLQQRQSLTQQIDWLVTSNATLRRVARSMRDEAHHATRTHLEQAESIVAREKRVSRLEDQLHHAQVKCNVSMHQCSASRQKVLEALSYLSVLNRRYSEQMSSIREARQQLDKLRTMAAKSQDDVDEYRGSMEETWRRTEAAASAFHSTMAELARYADNALQQFLVHRSRGRPKEAVLPRVHRTPDSRRMAHFQTVTSNLPFLDVTHDMPPDVAKRMRISLERGQLRTSQENAKLRTLQEEAEKLMKEVLIHLKKRRAKPVDMEMVAKELQRIQEEERAKAMAERMEYVLKGLRKVSRLLGCDETQLQKEGGLNFENLGDHLSSMEERVREISLKSHQPPDLDDMPLVLQEVAEMPSDRVAMPLEEEEKEEEEQVPYLLNASCMVRVELRRFGNLQPVLLDRDDVKQLLLSGELDRSDVLACRHLGDIM